MLDAELAYADMPTLPDDPQRVTEADVQEPLAVLVTCEWGYAGCMGTDVVAEMMRHDDGWICPVCYSTAQDEYDQYVWSAKYD